MKYFLFGIFFLFYSLGMQGQVIKFSGPTTFCDGGNVILSVAPIDGISGYQWINGATNVGTDAAIYTATASGSYTVKLSRIALADTIIGPVEVTVNPLPAITVNNASLCIGKTATLLASGANTYNWSPSTGLSPTTGSTVTANPSATNTYTVTGTNTTTGCTNTAISTVTVNPLPATPAFTFKTDGQCSNIPFNFDVTSPVAGNTYSWSFGDTETGTGSNVSHLFNALGISTQTFTVALNATSSAGCISPSINQVITVNQMPDPQLQDVKEFSPFNNCGNNTGSPVYKVDVKNITPNAANMSGYVINWGDGSPNSSVTNSSFPLTHTYSNYGIFNLMFTATNSNNGCINTKTYTVINQLNPAVGIEGPPGGSTQRCDSAGFWFKVKNYATNSPGTLYFWNFGDGTPIVTWTTPLTVDSIFHLFTKSSCELPGKEFIVSVTARNGCDNTTALINNIKIFKKPKADFEITPRTGCTNQVISFKNTSISAFNGPDCNNITNYRWDFGDPASGLQNNASTKDATHTYVTAGTYVVTLFSSGSCGVDSIFKTICITAPPSPAFALNTTAGCIPLTITTTNNTNIFNSCQTPTYSWAVTYAAAFCGTTSSWSFAGGSTAASTSPSFIFNSPGTYTITLSVTNACGIYKTTQTVDVKKPPTVTITPPSYPCGPVTITPVANIASCGTSALTYAWTFAGGIPATSNAANPGPVSFSAVGTHAITLAVTNECGTTAANSSVTVTAAPDVVVPANQNYCGGQTAGPFVFSSTVGSPSYRWTNSNATIGLAASGTGNISSFTAINNGTTPITATITVTPFVSAACSGAPVTFTITVNPRPTPPLVSTPVIYCLNATAVALSATAAAGNTLTWYNNIALTGGSTTAPTPSTSAQGSTLFYVTQTNSFICASPASAINVIVNPSILGNTIASDQNICSNTIPSALRTLNTVTGGSGTYIYQWQSSTDEGISWVNIASTNNATYSPPALLATIKYRRVINSSTCSDTSNIITITVQGALTNFDIAANQTICEGLTPSLLTGQLPTGGGGSYSYLWESSTNNISWTPTGNTGQDYQPNSLIQTTYFRRKLTASQCSAISPIVTITVNPTPIGIINTTNTSICEYDAGTVSFSATKGAAPFNIEFTITRPDGTDTTILQTINTNGPAIINAIPANSLPGPYIITLKKITDAKSCVNSSGSLSIVTINVKPRPILVLSSPPTVCNGTSTLLTASGATTYLWSPATGLSGTSGSSVTASPSSSTTYTLTGTLNNCISTNTILVTVTPGTTTANAGPAQILCNASNTTLAANNPTNGTGSWSQVGGPPAVITDTLLNNTTVTGLAGGQQYIFQWSISGLPPCPATVSKVTIDVLSSIVNSIKNDTIICLGQSVMLQTQNLSGGNTNSLVAQYSYQWESATPGQSNWQIIAGGTQASLTVSPLVSTCYRRKVKSNNLCETISNPVCVTVNPSISNNVISALQQVCVNVNPANLTGAIPTGGDNNYIYQWQTGTDGINWTNIGNNINYQPVAYTLPGIQYFRRNVTSGNCTSTSNIITITIRPDSKALFTASPSTACSPFNLTPAITVTALPVSNNLYQWYADGVLFGSNNTGVFPGYTILNPAVTVNIKLKTTSQFGCKPDSLERPFVTVITAQAKFTKDTSFGCGPLPVKFTNTSSLLNGIQFFWNFGNGATSTLAQPGTINFISSPFFNDTTYLISLKAFNGCDTTTWFDSVKVRSNPKARFGVDTTYGCSPFTIRISNTSPGGPNTYYWDLGNGVKDTSFANGSFNYTYTIGNTVDTVTIRLIAENQCGRDTQSINVRVAPNVIKPLINVNGSQLFGCAPHIVSFSNNTSGATRYTWNFGDNSAPLITNNNQTSVTHTYFNAGLYTVSIAITNGCSDTTVYRQVTVYTKPTAAFAASAAVYCAGDTIRVFNTSVNATNYNWFWGDGTTSTGANPVHVYAISGNYNILLQAERSNASGAVCLDTLVRPIRVLAKPVVNVQLNINVINCAPFKLNVSATGIINEKVTWYFYDSTVTPSIITSGNISAQYTFNKPGSYAVKLLAVNAGGCTDSTIIQFTVRGKAVASFTPADLALCTRDTTINYINTSTYNGLDPISYRWLVDDALVSTGANFSHRYNVLPAAFLPRIFKTALIVSNTVGCSDTAISNLQLSPLAKAQFSVTNLTECVPFKPVIINASTYTSSYRWQLNGVTVSTAANPDFVIFQGSTLYNIRLIADNIYGCKPDTFTVSFTSRTRPTASFKVSDTLGCTGVLNVGTTNLTTDATNYAWNWGDGSANSFFKAPTHLYSNPGQYLITLVATDGVCTDTTEQLVKVSIKPVVNFSADQTLTCDTARVQFTNLTTNGFNYEWSFGDGTFNNATNPFKMFPPRNAAYTVKLVATSTFGCKDSAVKANLILAKVAPASDFFISPGPVITVPRYTFSFNNLTLNSTNYKYLWSLGDGSFASTRDVTHKYSDTGNYAVRLIVLDTINNCPDTTTKIARIDGFPGYLFVPNAICPACIQTGLREFLPKGMGLKEYRLQIYTTWNELIFETRSLDSKGAPNQAWDGRFKGAIVQQDAYVWRIDAKFLNGSEWLGMSYPGQDKLKKAGTITVVK